MKKIKTFLLACVMVLSVFSFNVSAATSDEIMPLWDNTYSVVVSHRAIGTTSHCNVDIAIEEGSTIMNVVIKLINMDASPQTVVKKWTNPTMTVDSANSYNFYDTYSPIATGDMHRLVFQCEVWHNGVCDEISTYKDVTY